MKINRADFVPHILVYVVAPILGYLGLKLFMWLTMPDFSGLLQ